ncbi:MAG TPA: pyruvate dehydrogenase (acetyl-transferring), homodimeric type [Pirellulales bacterium]|jgi:pyruvate dehydrogenase E1 component|nr:pyruvate dehydrogenase (acetyl-transferring), homodimeric type [Pirellulales bacterium]
MAQEKIGSNSAGSIVGDNGFENGASDKSRPSNGASSGETGLQAEEKWLDDSAQEASSSVDETEGSIAEESLAEAPAELQGEPPSVSAEVDSDVAETQEWLESLRYVLESKGPERVSFLLAKLNEVAHQGGVALPFSATTPYVNTIPVDRQPPYPGNREIERRIKSIIRWNAMAMVVRANREHDGIGGHISTYASAATLYEVAFNHFFKGRGDDFSGDQVYIQGHAAPGIYARAYLEGRLTEDQLTNFRQELQPEGGLSSYPHPWLMPSFWEYPTVSMGLGPIMAIYQARFNKYLEDRGIKDTRLQKVWCFVGDGESDEPETLGALTLASRENLDNLIFVVNCNLQRLDGPVRGNGKIIQELEAVFRGAGWNVIKVVWGDDWDALLEKDDSGLLIKRMGEVVDGEYQKYVVSPGSYIREQFFGKYPELAKLVENMSDEKLAKLRRGGHDPEKVYAAFKAAVETTGRPTVILAKTIKGYGLGEAGEGRNITHQVKKVNEQELREFRSRFGIPISDDEVAKAPFYKPAPDTPEMKYLHGRRQELSGYVPSRPTKLPTIKTPSLEEYRPFIEKSVGREVSTTLGVVTLMAALLKDKDIGKYIVPIVPDESRTFGMDPLFRQCGIYAHAGQLYEPVDMDQVLYYREAVDGQILEEGITEAGSMSSFIAAGTAYSAHGVPMIPMFIYYSMFGFQRIGDLIWAAGDMRARGFMFGGTAGRTTLNGEGLQHQDGHSHLFAIAYPTVKAYDPAFVYESTVIILDGMRRMYQEGEDTIYYLTIHNEGYEMPAMPQGAKKGEIEEGIIRGMYKFKTVEAGDKKLHVQLLGSGAILRSVLHAQKLLAEKFDVSSTVWSVTSYKELRKQAHACRRWNMLHPNQRPKVSYIEHLFDGLKGPFVAASDNVRAVAEQIDPWVPSGLFALGTDGFGRSETRANLRRHFEVDSQCIAVAALYRLAEMEQFDRAKIAAAIEEWGINPEKVDPLFA